MKRSLLITCLLGLSAGASAFGPLPSAVAQNALEQLQFASRNNNAGTVPLPMSKAWETDNTNLLLQDAYRVDLAGNSDNGASRGVFALKRINRPSGYSMITTPLYTTDTDLSVLAGGPMLIKKVTLGSVDYFYDGGVVVRLAARPDGEDYFDAFGRALFGRTATPSEDVFADPNGIKIFTKTTPDGETTIFSCGDGASCMVIKHRPWGDEFFVDGKRIMLRAACPGGDVFYGEGDKRILVRVSEPGGDTYYRPANAPVFPDIVKILRLPGDPVIWRAVLFDHKRGRTQRRIIWPIPAMLY